MFQLRLCLSVLVIIMVVSTWSTVQCYNILAIFPHPGMSHWLFFRPIIEELVRRGHEVTLLSYFGLEDAQLKGRINYHEHLFKGAPALTNTRDLKVRRSLRRKKKKILSTLSFPSYLPELQRTALLGHSLWLQVH